MPQNVSLLTIPSIVPKVMRPKKNSSPRYVHYFPMNFEQWRAFFNHKIYDVYSDWGNQLIPHFKRLGITCGIVFRYHKVRGKDSRKINSNLFNGVGHCKGGLCPVTVLVQVSDEPKKKHSPCMFKVVVTGDKNHDPKQETIARPITGAVREAMGMLVFFC
jgi:hypothetical protein